MLEETIQGTLFPKGCNPANPRQTSATGEMAISIAMEAVRTRLPRKSTIWSPCRTASCCPLGERKKDWTVGK